MQLTRLTPAALVVLLAATAAAEPLGPRSQYIITSDARLDYQRTSTVAPDGAEATRTDYAFRFAIDYTVGPRISLGGLVGFEGFITDDTSAKAFVLGTRAGYLVPLGAYTTWWPRLGLSYANTGVLDERGQSATIRSFRVNVSAPFVFQPYPQVLVGVGPTYDRDLSAKLGPEDEGPKAQAIGVHLLFGLWFY
ncbi:MAG TPA: hypothetical protein VM734_13490 [Kofleriaceae bacterium]|nr:hypothetical protein [Kofleriaceae bacterium]